MIHTYRAWLRQGFTVRKGEKAQFYAVSPDQTEWLALFSEEQTEPLIPDPVDETWSVVPAAERPTRRQPAPAGDKIHVDYASDEHKVYVWVGASKAGISSMKRSKFWFSRESRRWVAKRDDIATVVKALHESGKFRIQLTIDGESREIDDSGQILPLRAG